MRNNADWLRDLPLMDFLREAGRYLTLGCMLQKESVRSRHGKRHQLHRIQLHGDPGVRLLAPVPDRGLRAADRRQRPVGQHHGGYRADRQARREAAYGLVFPLITTASGAKFGKSEAGNIWLDPAKTSPYQFYQFWINTDDRDVERYLKLFTFLPLDEIAAPMAEHARDPGKRLAQRLLAGDITVRVHGRPRRSRR